MKKYEIVLSWILRIIIALGFLLASSAKLLSDPGVVELFKNWGFPNGFHLLIGALELILAVMILIPKTLKVAIFGLLIIMVGALITHLINDPISNIIRPLIFMIFLGLVFYFNFKQARSIQK
ncbi:MAG: DoxX family protein [Flavobacteriaceae bacterium]|nr:DoxX family protein [Flavobacteriaceae bacterium]